MNDQLDILSTDSQKSYFVAVCLSGIFGTLGIHHFYLGRWLHGIFDLTLAILAVVFIFIMWPIGILLAIADFIHSVYVTYKLIVGEYNDGSGRPGSVPR